MFEKSAMLYLYVETPLHAGSGTNVGVIDLPIQRERVTNYPMAQSSGIKGKLRAEAVERAGSEEEKKKVLAVFGPENNDAAKHAGALSPGDARILLFPVRSLAGVFAWTTSSNVLARLKRDVESMRKSYTAGTEPEWLRKLSEWQTPDDPPANQAFVTTGSKVEIDGGGRVVLEEFAFETPEDAAARENVTKIAGWLSDWAFPEGDEYRYWRERIKNSLVILPEDAFRDFTQFATEVITRIRIEQEKKTVANGALWTEEHLPSDTLLYAPLSASRPRADETPTGMRTADDVLKFVTTDLKLDRIQLGGDETVGRGIVKLRFS